MTLKDWKKIKDANVEFRFYNRKLKPQQQITFDRGYLEIFTIHPYNKITFKYLKTKSKALKYAKAYMRKH